MLETHSELEYKIEYSVIRGQFSTPCPMEIGNTRLSVIAQVTLEVDLGT